MFYHFKKHKKSLTWHQHSFSKCFSASIYTLKCLVHTPMTLVVGSRPTCLAGLPLESKTGFTKLPRVSCKAPSRSPSELPTRATRRTRSVQMSHSRSTFATRASDTRICRPSTGGALCQLRRAPSRGLLQDQRRAGHLPHPLAEVRAEAPADL